MKPSTQKILIGILVLIAVLGTGFYLFKKNIGSINIPQDSQDQKIENGENSKDPESVLNSDKLEPLSTFTLPAGFSMNVFAKGVKGARVIELDPKGRILVSQTSEGKIVALTDKNYNGVSDEQKVLISGLKKPHGMAMHCNNPDDKCFLYVAEADALSRFAYDSDTPSLGAKEKLMDIEYSLTDNHFTRYIIFLPFPNEDTLLVSVGSSCNVCIEEDTEHATILSYNIKSGKKEIYAKGLRNATFLTLNPVSGKVFASEMGRDGLGDNVPPDEINIIEKKDNQPNSQSNSQPLNYGWPNCYGKNIHDTNFDKNTYIRNPCMSPFEVPSFIDLPAHSAPLGLSFIPEEGWPESHWYNLLVAYHGSWNRSTPTGYKIVRIKMNAKGEYLGTEDFITGWLKNDGKIGRPADIKVFSGGKAYISDDGAGVIYRLWKT